MARAKKTSAKKLLRPHPARDQIIDVMRAYGRPISPKRLSEVTGVTLGVTAYHVRALVAAGTLELADEDRVRGAVEHFYRLVDGAEAAQLRDPLAVMLAVCGALTMPAAGDGYPVPVELDDQARAELQQLLDQLRPRVERVARGAARRL